MFAIFTTVLEMSMTASVVVVAVLAARVVLKRMPKIFSYILWALVLFRLLCPVSITSDLSVFQILHIPERVESEENREIERKTYYVTMEETVVTTDVVSVDASKQPAAAEVDTAAFDWKNFVCLIWVSGAVVLIGRGVITGYALKKQLIGSWKEKNNIYLCDYITTPFVFGIVSPRIYLPSNLTETEKEYIVLHEQIHIRRGDHLLRLLASLALAIHWFNPFVWIAFYVSAVDMEMSCDEAVMRRMGKDIRGEYASSLLNIAVGKKILIGSMIAFGENSTKRRIENVMKYKKHATVVLIIAVFIVGILLVTLGSDPKEEMANSQAVDNVTEEGQQQQTEELQQTEYQTEQPTEQDAANKETAIKEGIERWAAAFCNRDGNIIVSMSSEDTIKKLEEMELLTQGKNAVSFGYSSPWPISYYIREMTDSEAVILYYAFTSEPHYTVWKEHLTFALEGEIQIIESELTYFDNIKTSSEFQDAYKEGINVTQMNYFRDDTGEALNANALEDKESKIYSQLFTPETAAISLLNLDGDAVTIESREAPISGSVVLAISFEDAKKRQRIKMVQPYGTNGIWIPQDMERAEQFDNYAFYKEQLGENFLVEYYDLVCSINTDVAGDGNAEVIEVYEGNIGDGDSGYVLVKDAQGKLLHHEFAHVARAGWNNIYLSEQDFLMNVHIEDRDTYGEYSYQVYRVHGENEIEVLDEHSFSFDERQPYSQEEFKEFMEPLSRYLSASYLLLSTQDGEVRTERVSEADKYSYEKLVKNW